MTIIFNKISIIGLGLIGTSILHAIKVKDDKKVFADSIVLTTALLKNCVKV